MNTRYVFAAITILAYLTARTPASTGASGEQAPAQPESSTPAPPNHVEQHAPWAPDDPITGPHEEAAKRQLITVD